MDEKRWDDLPEEIAGSVVDRVNGTASPLSAAATRFHSCRWRKAPENGSGECCGHRDVLPLTGANGFDAEAWCPECALYKLRRTPRKREAYDFGY